jgi:hypothetical protein
VDVVEIVEMNDDVLEEGSAVRYQILPKKSKLLIKKNWKNYA